MVVKDKKITTNENEKHFWLRSRYGYIRLTEDAYNKALESAKRNEEDKPELNWLKKLVILFFNL